MEFRQQSIAHLIYQKTLYVKSMRLSIFDHIAIQHYLRYLMVD